MRDKVERSEEFAKKFEDLDADYLKTVRPPEHIAIRAGDKIWVNRKHVTLKSDKELSNETIEVIDVLDV